MTFNTSQVSYYMTQRKKGITQHISAMKAGISVRSGRRIEKGEWAKNSVRHWRTRKDPLEAVWDSMLVCSSVEEAGSDTNNSAGDAGINIPASTPTAFEEQCNGGSANGSYSMVQSRVMFRQRHQPGLRGLSDFTELKV